MLVELPDAASILTGLFIFLIGFIAIITYFKVKLYVNSKKIHKDPAQLERLEYYERQLIDLKIRLDTIDLENVPKSEIKSKKASIEPTNTEQVEKNEKSQTTSTSFAYFLLCDLCRLQLLETHHKMNVIGRTREHLRLMKKLCA